MISNSVMTSILHGNNFHCKAELTKRQSAKDNSRNSKGRHKHYAREPQSDEPWERVYIIMNDFKSDLGGLSKLVNENAAKIEALTQSKQRAACKENVQEQTSGDQKQGKFAGAAVKGKGKQPKVAPPYEATIQDLRSDSDSLSPRRKFPHT